MPGNSFGQAFRITTAGESHGPGNVVIIDGVPPGIALSVEDLLVDLNRRRPGQSKIVTQRQEADEPEILSGVFEGKTTGTAYWVGAWDGERFTPDGSGHQWLDHGPDYYAAVTWDDPRLDEQKRLATRYSIGWMNNWAYAGKFPTE